MNAESIENLKLRIMARDAGEARFDLVETCFSPDNINDYVELLDLTGIDKWIELSPSEARAVLARILHKDLAYDQQCLEIGEAESIGDSFIALFSESAKFFTNASWSKNVDDSSQSEALGNLSSWNPISDATFDVGVVAGDDRLTGIIWVEDED